MDVMIDIETLAGGYRPVVASIGAVRFNLENGVMVSDFYTAIDIENAQREGGHIDAATVRWWLEQSKDAQQELHGDTPLVLALADLADWLPNKARVWGNGSNFDNRILREVYEMVGMQCPWHWRNDGDMRTFKDLAKRQLGGRVPSYKRVGTHHNALDDAKTQAQWMIDTFNLMSSE